MALGTLKPTVIISLREEIDTRHLRAFHKSQKMLRRWDQCSVQPFGQSQVLSVPPWSTPGIVLLCDGIQREGINALFRDYQGLGAQASNIV